MRISDWSSDVCSSDLSGNDRQTRRPRLRAQPRADPRGAARTLRQLPPRARSGQRHRPARGAFRRGNALAAVAMLGPGGTPAGHPRVADEAALDNTPLPLALDVSDAAWPRASTGSGRFDAMFSANTLHIMG